MWKCRKFSHHFCPVSMWSPKKIKKKRSSRRWRHLFLRFYVDLQKKKVFRLSSPTFLRDFCDIPERNAVNRGCLRFLAGNKNAGFWREKKRRNSQNFSAKMPEKISHFSHFFALIGNTAGRYTIVILIAAVPCFVNCDRFVVINYLRQTAQYQLWCTRPYFQALYCTTEL